MAGDRRPRMTLPTQLVLHVLIDDPNREMYGLQLGEAAGLPSGTIHPILARLEKAGWLTSRWEEIDAREEGRPRRRYYRLDPNSLATVRAALHRAAPAVEALARLRPGQAGGVS
ncbi:DNA-binding PadR family transcriptional regulator [Amycolatopsis lexingtonensis]|uniref:DNA-binding PadR family transcriptional regulator n=1 Tax=Amycolatopsis lexingtonensis TaxID=218822 RepID=A0ABR9I4F7_9PSEU|nr:helix-turn-helix transcriptional regulator [Amycolatopsis lexingtonensis]MBE1498072.1 DNA-binding PadR family transcriptional regulator [Amycolatopsis lexingtonensis]